MSLSVGGVRRTPWKVDWWRSPDGTVEARTVGEVQKDAAQGRKLEESWEDWPLTNFGWSYFIPNRYDGVCMNVMSRSTWNRSLQVRGDRILCILILR